MTSSASAQPPGCFDRLVRTLDRSPHAAEFRTWGTMLWQFGAIVFIGHAVTFLLLQTEHPQKPLLWVARFGQFALLGLLFWLYRGVRTVLPTSMAERQLWSIWVGYLVAFTISSSGRRSVSPMKKGRTSSGFSSGSGCRRI